MECYVLKFGGTSLSTPQRIEHVARLIKKRYSENQNNLAVVVSAMAGVTNQLSAHIKAISVLHSEESDVVLAAGEQITAGLLSLSLQKLGLKSKSFLGWQLPILTENNPTLAKIINIETTLIKQEFSKESIPIIAGFQGVTNEGRITTLGRGGSDITAVELAYFLKAKRCDIYTDVDGVYTIDPQMIPSAKKLNFLNYQTMWELSKNGAQVLQTRSVELAMNKNVIIQVLSSFLPDNQGTIISIQEDIKQEDFPIIGIASCTTEDGKSCISLVGSNFDKHTAFLEFLMELLKKYNISIWNFKSSFTNIFKNQSLSKICFFVSSCDLLKTLHLLHDKLLKSSYLKFQG